MIMPLTDDIVAIIILVIVLILASVLFTQKIITSETASATSKHEAFLEDYYSTAINSFMHLTDNITHKQFNVVLGDYYLLGRYIGNPHDPALLKHQVEAALNNTLGQNNYYMNLTPVMTKSIISFVIDGSDSLSNERKILGSGMQTFISNLNQIFIIPPEIKIYILTDKPETTMCAPFPDIQSLNCKAVGFDELYSQGHFDVQPPSFGHGSYAEWEQNNPYTLNYKYFFFSADWVAGTIYATKKFIDEGYQRAGLSLNIVIPVSDKLSTNSIATECFNLEDRSDYIVCSLCNNDCSSAAARSRTYLNEDTYTFLNNHNTIVIPLQSTRCSFNYDPSWNYLQPSDYTNQYVSITKGFPVTPDLCSKPGCAGCSPGPPGEFCFHKNCEGEVTAQMNELATRTGGQLFNMEDISGDLAAQLSNIIEDAVNNYYLEFGSFDPERQRYVIERNILLPSSVTTKMSLVVYKDPYED